jgi:hypothetical protein
MFHGITTVWPRDIGKPLFSWLTANCKEQFEGTIRNALNLGIDNSRLDALIEALPDEVDYRKRNIPNITRDAIRKVRGTGVGYYTFRFNQLFGNADDIFFCRLESLRPDLVNFFDGIGAASDELRAYAFVRTRKTLLNTFTIRPIIHGARRASFNSRPHRD